MEMIGYVLSAAIFGTVILLALDAAATLMATRMGCPREPVSNFDPIKVLIIAGITVFAIILWAAVRSAS